jgi:hypothetical protein
VDFHKAVATRGATYIEKATGWFLHNPDISKIAFDIELCSTAFAQAARVFVVRVISIIVIGTAVVGTAYIFFDHYIVLAG